MYTVSVANELGLTLEQIYKPGTALVSSQDSLYVLKTRAHPREIESEALALQQLSSVSRVANLKRDYGEVLGFRTILKEYVPGVPFTELSREERSQHLPSLLSLIEEIHGAGVAIIDLTPQNVLLGEDGRPYLFDFNMARSYPQVQDSRLTVAKEHDLRMLSRICSV